MEEQQSAVQAAVRPGLIMGLLALVLTYLIYFVDSSILINTWYGLGSLVIFLVLIIVFGSQYRKEIGGFIDFGNAFKFSFVAILVSGVVALLGQILLYHVVDPDLAGVLAEKSVENTLAMMESFGAPADSMTPEMMDEMRTNTQEAFTIVGQIKSFGWLLIFYAVVSLITGAIIKKKDKSLDY